MMMADTKQRPAMKKIAEHLLVACGLIVIDFGRGLSTLPALACFLIELRSR